MWCFWIISHMVQQENLCGKFTVYLEARRQCGLLGLNLDLAFFSCQAHEWIILLWPLLANGHQWKWQAITPGPNHWIPHMSPSVFSSLVRLLEKGSLVERMELKALTQPVHYTTGWSTGTKMLPGSCHFVTNEKLLSHWSFTAELTWIYCD